MFFEDVTLPHVEGVRPQRTAVVVEVPWATNRSTDFSP